MLNQRRLQEAALAYGIELSGEMLQKLDEYASMLAEWNERMNLTAITQPEEVETKHFLDSLLLAVQPEVAGRMVDVGSGAGFPGLVAKVYKPDLDVTLMEPTGKRVTFLQAVASALPVKVEVVKERAEEAARKAWRESFGVATARAVASLPALCEYCLPLVRVGGWFIAMKGEADKELEAAQAAISKLGGTYRETRPFRLPDGSGRSLLLIQKTEATPAAYPRNGGVIAKKPL